MQILGNIIIEESDFSNENTIELKLESEDTHVYLFENGKLYYKILDENDNITKNLILCPNINSCTFEYENNVLSVQMTIGSKIYKDKFSL